MRRRSFTLVEVLTVIAIIGILVSIGAYIYSAALIRSRDSQRISDLQFIRNGLEQFYLDNRSYPLYDKGSNLPQATWQLEAGYPCQNSTFKTFLAPKYLSAIPQDPSHPFTISSGTSCSGDTFGRYLYFGLPLDTSKASFYLMARMERAKNINYDSAVTTTLKDNGYSGVLASLSLNFCSNTPNDQCSQNYSVTNAKNN